MNARTWVNRRGPPRAAPSTLILNTHAAVRQAPDKRKEALNTRVNERKTHVVKQARAAQGGPLDLQQHAGGGAAA